MKIIQTKHLKNSVARKQVCVPSKLHVRRNHFIGSHLEFSPPQLASRDLTVPCPPPHPELDGDLAPLTLPTPGVTLPETHPPLCPTQSPGAVSPAPSASASPGPHSPIFLRICWMAPWTSPTSISDSACVQSSFWALSSQGGFISGDALTRPTALLSCLVVSTLRCPWVFSSFIPFALSCLSGACGRKHMGFGDRTEFESQVVLPLSDCVPFHKLLQISESQFPLRSEENSTCHTGLLWGLKWKLIY